MEKNTFDRNIEIFMSTVEALILLPSCIGWSKKEGEIKGDVTFWKGSVYETKPRFWRVLSKQGFLEK